MSDKPSPTNGRISSPLSESAKLKQQQHKQRAEQMLKAYYGGDAKVIAEFKEHCFGGDQPDFRPTLLQARMLASSDDLAVRKLSLEKLKKEAKDLLKALKSNSPAAQKRLAQHHTKSPAEELKLADAQLIIARENGLPSWPRLKAHIETQNAASQQIQKNNRAPDGDLKTLHIRCGNDIKEAIGKCGFTGDFLEISNPFPQGPVPHFEPLDQFVSIRTDFITNNYGNDVPKQHIENTFEEISKTEQTLRSLNTHYERVVLWYEHDPFDQLSKAYVLAHLSELDLKNTVVECIQINNFPGVKRFIGIGQLSRTPEIMLMLWFQRQTVTQTMIAFGARCWQAFISDAPQTLWQLTQEKGAALPLMQHSMLRTLKELPWMQNGLSLTEQLALDILKQEGPMRPGPIFNLLLTESEPLHFLGDIMLLSILRELWQAPNAAIKVIKEYSDEHPMRAYRLAITDIGTSLLDGDIDWIDTNQETPGFVKYVGGVQVRPGTKHWRWSCEENKPVLIN